MSELEKTTTASTVPATEEAEAGSVQRGASPRASSKSEVVDAKAPRSTPSPFALMRKMFEDMDRIFTGTGAREATERAAAPRAEAWSPPIEMFSRKDAFVVRADLPGIAPEDVRVHVDEDGLHLEGERRTETEREHDGVFETERTYGAFRRRIALPKNVDASKEIVKLENGVLEITFAMKATHRRAIDIGSAARRAPSAAKSTLPETPRSQGRNGTTESPRH